MHWRTRLEVYGVVASVAGVVGFFFGKRYADPPGCDDPGECSLGVEFGFMWGGLALVAVLALLVVIEMALRLRPSSP